MTHQWLMAIYGLLTCLGGGTVAFTGLSAFLGRAPKARKLVAIVAAVLLLAGGCVLAFAVGKPSGVIALATNAVKGSPKSLEFVAMLACFAAAVVCLVVEARAESETPVKVVGIVACVLGVLAPIACGASAAVGRAALVVALPVSFLGTGLLFGGSVLASIMAVVGNEADDLGEERTDDFKKCVLATLVAAAVQAIGFVLVAVLTGFAVPALAFWLGAVAVGTVVPIICLAASTKARALAFASLLCSAAGAVCIRWCLILVGTGSLNLIATAASHKPL